MTDTESMFVCCQCRQAWPIGELAVAFSAAAGGGRGYCLVCFTRLAGNTPPRLSRELARDVETTLAAITTDFFTREP